MPLVLLSSGSLQSRQVGVSQLKMWRSSKRFWSAVNIQASLHSSV